MFEKLDLTCFDPTCPPKSQHIMSPKQINHLWSCNGMSQMGKKEPAQGGARCIQSVFNWFRLSKSKNWLFEEKRSSSNNWFFKSSRQATHVWLQRCKKKQSILEKFNGKNTKRKNIYTPTTFKKSWRRNQQKCCHEQIFLCIKTTVPCVCCKLGTARHGLFGCRNECVRGLLQYPERLRCDPCNRIGRKLVRVGCIGSCRQQFGLLELHDMVSIEGSRWNAGS